MTSHVLTSRVLAAGLLVALAGSGCGDKTPHQPLSARADSHRDNGIASMSAADALAAADQTMSSLDDVSWKGFTSLAAPGNPRADFTLVMTSDGSCKTDLVTKVQGAATVLSIDDINYVRFDAGMGQILLGVPPSAAGPYKTKWGRAARRPDRFR